MPKRLNIEKFSTHMDDLRERQHRSSLDQDIIAAARRLYWAKRGRLAFLRKYGESSPDNAQSAATYQKIEDELMHALEAADKENE